MEYNPIRKIKELKIKALLYISDAKFTRTDLPPEYQAGLATALIICCFSMVEAPHFAISWFILLLWLLESDMMTFQNDLVLIAGYTYTYWDLRTRTSSSIV